MGMCDRTEMLLGNDAVNALKNTHVALFGLGAVGGYALEGLVRMGIGHITVVDGDVFSESNLNRQLLATTDTIGRRKTDVAIERAKSINPDIKIEGISSFIDSENIEKILEKNPDIVVDAIDTIGPKCELLKKTIEKKIPVFSSMGAAMHIDSQSIKVATLSKTKVCPLASNIRNKLKNLDTSSIICIYSEEKPISIQSERDEHGKSVLGSIPTIPAIFGMMLVNEVIKKVVFTTS